MDANVTKILLEIKEEQGHQRAISAQILEQTKKTNGRVNRLEDRVDDLEEAADISEGAAKVRSKTRERVWEVSKYVISAGIGAVAAMLKGGK